MIIKSIRIIATELTQKLKVFTDSSIEYGPWEVEPDFGIGYNPDGVLVQNIEVEIIRTIGNQHAQIKVMTSIEIEVGSKEYIPTTDQNFLEYASLAQIAIAHARAFFVRETIGTKFSGELLPIDNFGKAFERIKSAVFNQTRLN